MIPTQEELMKYLTASKSLVNFSKIRRKYKITKGTVKDLVSDLQSKKLVRVETIGRSKIVRVIEK